MSGMSFSPFLVLAVVYTPSPECPTRRCDLRILSRHSPLEGLLACLREKSSPVGHLRPASKARFRPEPPRDSRLYPSRRAMSAHQATLRAYLSVRARRCAAALGATLLQPGQVVPDELAAVLVVADEAVEPAPMLVQPDRVQVVAAQIPEALDGMARVVREGSDAALL